MPKGASGAQEAREVLQKHGVDINSPANGVSLPKNAASQGIGDTRIPHRGEGIHSNQYNRYINESFRGTRSKADAQERLDRIRKELQNKDRKDKKPWDKD